MNKWDQRFLSLAKEISTWSKDPSTQVGAVIAKDKKVLGHGFNGFPPNIEDKEEWLYDRPTKYSMVIHAEVNAILNTPSFLLPSSSLYIYPLSICGECAKLVCAAGIESVLCWVPSPNGRWDDTTSRVVFERAGVSYETVLDF